jgi:hypothetical protein
MDHPFQRARWPAGRWLCATAVALLVAGASCRNDASDPRAAPQTPGVAADPVRIADSRPDHVGPDREAPDDVDAEQVNRDGVDLSNTVNLADLDLSDADLFDMESIEANPLGGCVSCHVDIEDELKVSIHLVEEVGCVECHGPSDGHVRDENNEVAPDQVFARKDVDRLCGECHKCSRPKAEQQQPDRKVCTDCHQPHSLALASSGQQ